MTVNEEVQPVEPADEETPVTVVEVVAKPVAAPVEPPRFSVTGELDADTIDALQFALGVKRTKTLDEKTMKALQKRLGVEASGEWSRETRYALQRWLGLSLTPTLDSRTVTALQRRLAAGTVKW